SVGRGEKLATIARERQHTDGPGGTLYLFGRLASLDIPATQKMLALMTREQRFAIVRESDCLDTTGGFGEITEGLAGEGVPTPNRVFATPGQEFAVPTEGDGLDLFARKRQALRDLARGGVPDEHKLLASRGEPVALGRVAGGEERILGLPAAQLSTL